MAAGLVTALPLLCFAKAAKEITLTSLGMIQYLTPVMQMLWAVFVVNERIAAARWVGYVVIWIAVSIFMWDLFLLKRRPSTVST